MFTQQDLYYASKSYNLTQMGGGGGGGGAWKNCDLGCRVCWGIITGGSPAVDTGYAPFHAECYDAFVAYLKSQEEVK